MGNIKSRAFKPGELPKILKLCGISKSRTEKIPAFAIGQNDSKEQNIIAKSKLVKFKADKPSRLLRDSAKVATKKSKSKQTPKGTIAKKKSIAEKRKFIIKKKRRSIEASRIRQCKLAKFKKAA